MLLCKKLIFIHLNQIIMKKSFTTIALAVACMFGFSACDEADLEDILNSSNALGHITLTTADPSEGTQAYNGGENLNFKSAVCHVFVDEHGVPIVDAGNIFVGTTESVVNENVTTTFPICGLKVYGHEAGDYAITCPVQSFDFIDQISHMGIYRLMRFGIVFANQPQNLFVLAASEDGYYIGYEGTIHVSQFGAEGELVEGTLDNVKALYITKQEFKAIANMEPGDRPQDLTTQFPHITFNGEISSRRVTTEQVVSALEEAPENPWGL